jgi:hypothetical protein
MSALFLPVAAVNAWDFYAHYPQSLFNASLDLFLAIASLTGLLFYHFACTTG